MSLFQALTSPLWQNKRITGGKLDRFSSPKIGISFIMRKRYSRENFKKLMFSCRATIAWTTHVIEDGLKHRTLRHMSIKWRTLIHRYMYVKMLGVYLIVEQLWMNVWNRSSETAKNRDVDAVFYCSLALVK